MSVHSLSAEDERAIIAVLLRYATGIDKRDWPLFATCFTEDVEADYGALGRWHGRDVLVNHMMRGHAALGPTLHRLTNFVIADATGNGDTALATSYVDALLMHPTSGAVLRQAHGRYEDKLRRMTGDSIQGTWKIESRRFVSVLIDPPK